MLHLDIVAWIIIIALFIVAFVGLVYPIIPSVLFLLGGFIAYGLFYGFSELPWWFKDVSQGSLRQPRWREVRISSGSR